MRTLMGMYLLGIASTQIITKQTQILLPVSPC